MIDIVAGQTGPIYRYLRIDGATPKNPDGSALSMSGMSVALIVHDLSENALTIAGTVSIQDADAWLVKFSPNTADFPPGQYRARFKVTDGTGLFEYFPNVEGEQLIARAA